jgi:hypothetical protein
MGCWISTNPYYKTQTNKQNWWVWGADETWIVGECTNPTQNQWVMYKPGTKPNHQLNTKPLNIWASRGHVQ